MKRRKLSTNDKSTSVASIFFLFCVLLIGIGLLIKVSLIYFSAKFDGVHQVILEVQEAPTKTAFVALSPDTQTASMLIVQSSTAKDFEKYLELPVDVHVVADPTLPLSDLGQYILFHQNRSDTLNIVDRIRVFLYTSGIKTTDISQKAIHLETNGTVDGIIPELFIDHTLYTDNKTIAVVNGTGISGLGSDVARMISNVGGNVISVTTGDSTQVSSLVYHGRESYTTKRLSEIFHVAARQTPSTMLSDIVITIGKKDASHFE